MASLSIITPTVGRDTLLATLDSVNSQLGRYDEHIVIGDGPQPWARQLCSTYKRTRYLQTDNVTAHWGNEQRDLGIASAKGDYVMFCDDDDVLTEDALKLAKTAIAEAEGALFIFQMQLYGYNWCGPGHVLWRDQQIRDGNVGTLMLVAPKLADMPAWGVNYNADLAWVFALAKRCEVQWREQIIAIARPHKKPPA